MRAIVKKREPKSLVRHREAGHSHFDNLEKVDKQVIRESLVQEQRGLCCYCMQRIYASETHMKVEHWRSQDDFSELQLCYANILAACLGGEGLPRRIQHCDTRKRNEELKWNPADPAHQIELRIKYDPNGKIWSEDTDFDQQLNNVLNFNLSVFMNNRKAVLEGILEWWSREKARCRGPLTRRQLLRKRDQIAPKAGDLEPFKPVGVWWLNQKLEKMSTSQ